MPLANKCRARVKKPLLMDCRENKPFQQGDGHVQVLRGGREAKDVPKVPFVKFHLVVPSNSAVFV